MKKTNLRHTLLILSCVILTALGFTVLNAYSTTTIGLDINTGDITSTGTITGQDLTIEKSDDTTLTIYSNTDSPTENDKLLIIQKGISPTELFSVDEDGDVIIASDLSINNDLAITGNVTLGNPVTTQYGGTGQDWSATTQGNLPYFSGTGTLSNLAPGTTGQFLSQGSDGNPEWNNVVRTVTVVVAAADSSRKEEADYVCTGENDQETIQAAMNSFGDDDYAGTIHLMAGLYNISSPILWPNKYGITLEGEFGRRSDKCPTSSASSKYSGGTTLHLDDGADCSMIVFPATNDHIKYAQMRNIVLIGNKSGQTPGVASHGVEVLGTISDSFFDRVIIMCFEGDGWHIDPPSAGVGTMWHVGISNTWIEHNTNGIFIDGANFTSALTRLILTNMFFMGNDYALRFEHVGSTSGGPQIIGCYSEDPIYIYDANGILFSACDIINTDTTRPTFYTMSGANSRCMITGSNLRAASGQRLFDGTWGGWLIEGNRISGSAGGLIVCNNASSIIRNNQGYITENSGTDTIANGATHKDVTHGLAVT
ncbi:hypothetical protein KA005_23880, partial [bacterium]|nr:hypothetical protein [bacterium]